MYKTLEYKGYKILAEVYSDRCLYSVDSNGNMKEFIGFTETHPFLNQYVIWKEGTAIDYHNTIDACKEHIDKLTN